MYKYKISNRTKYKNKKENIKTNYNHYYLLNNIN
jgi:hypothetical protein